MLRIAQVLLLALVLLSGPALAQGDASGPERFFILMQGYTAGGFSGSGLSSSFGVPVADVGRVNPAALGAVERPAAGLTYRFATAIEEGYVAGIGYGPMNGARPQSAAVAVPLGSFALGLSYDQRYAAEMDFGCIPSTAGDPEPESFCARDAARLETVSPQAAYRSTLRNGGELAVGVRVGFGYGQYERVIDSLAVSVGDWGTQVALGASFRVPDAFGLAAYYESALRVEEVMDHGLLFVPGGSPGAFSVPYADALPARLGLSAEWVPTPSLTLGADVARVFWKAAWDGNDQFQDDTDAALWARLDLSERVLASLGLLSSGRNRWDNGFDEIFGYSGRAVYLTLGGALTVGNVQLEAVVADSRLLSADQHRQTIAQLGASVGL